MVDRDVAAAYRWWMGTRAVFHRGYWLVTSLYLVVEADLSPFQLVFVGTAQGLTALVAEVPTGVVADTVSRKRSLVIAHLVMGTGMLATGLVTTFPALVLTQMLWGLGWTFASGADVAWLTDELDQPHRTASVLTASARWEQIGAAGGMLAFGALAWWTDLATAIVASGVSMGLLGGFVATRFTEHHFTPIRVDRWHASLATFRRGVAVARFDHQILLVCTATFLVNGAAEAFERLFPRRLVELGFPASPDPIVWFTALGLVTLAVGALGLRIVETHIEGAGAARRIYACACLAGALGAAILASAPDEVIGMAGVLLAGGIAWPVTRCVGVIWVNRRTTSDVRATVQSFLGQVEYLGEILLGVSLGVLAQARGIPVALVGSCGLLAAAGVWVARSRAARDSSDRKA